MLRPVCTLPLPAKAISKLRENGFYYLEDVLTEKGLSPEVRDILKPWGLHQNDSWLQLKKAPLARSAMDVWQEEIAHGGIATFSKAIDKLLGGGIPTDVLTEFCGSPGSGKTQLCLQLCVNVQLPREIGGLGGEAVFIDTCSGFTVSRIREIAEACQAHCSLLGKACTEVTAELSKLSIENLLNGVHVISVIGCIQLVATIFSLKQFLEQHSRVRLIIVDSLSFPFVGTATANYLERISLLYRVLSELHRLSHKFKLAVVVTNQLTTRISTLANDQVAELVPALGETFAQRINQRILLGDMASIRTAALIKGRVWPDITTVPFVISKHGIRDC